LKKFLRYQVGWLHCCANRACCCWLRWAIYLILILYGYDRNDPAWSNSASDAVPHNSGGVFGAWLADVLLYVFGFSACVVGCIPVAADMGGLSRHIAKTSLFDRRALWVALSGFVVLLLASSSLEALRLHTLKAALPLAPGGMLGVVLGDGLAHLLGLPVPPCFCWC